MQKVLFISALLFSSVSAQAADGLALAQKYGCLACHAVDHKVIGPAYRDVAAKYKGQNVEATLVAKVKAGGSGVWGPVPMIANAQVPDADLHLLVKWVLSQK